MYRLPAIYKMKYQDIVDIFIYDLTLSDFTCQKCSNN